MNNVATLAATMRRLDEIHDLTLELPLDLIYELLPTVDDALDKSYYIAKLSAHLRSVDGPLRVAIISRAGAIFHHVVCRCTVSLDDTGWPRWRAVEIVTQLRPRDLHRARHGRMRTAGLPVQRSEHREIPAPGARLSGDAAQCLRIDLCAQPGALGRKGKKR